MHRCFQDKQVIRTERHGAIAKIFSVTWPPPPTLPPVCLFSYCVAFIISSFTVCTLWMNIVCSSLCGHLCCTKSREICNFIPLCTCPLFYTSGNYLKVLKFFFLLFFSYSEQRKQALNTKWILIVQLIAKAAHSNSFGVVLTWRM